jgi:general stress protein YciG
MPTKSLRVLTGSTNTKRKSRRGFAAMSPEQQREIARKGGLRVSSNRKHMREIAKIGGEHSHRGAKRRRER